MDIEDIKAHRHVFFAQIELLETKRGNGSNAVPRSIDLQELDALIDALRCADSIAGIVEAQLSSEAISAQVTCTNAAHSPSKKI